MPMFRYVVGLLLLTTLVACAADDPNKRTKAGAAVGALVGAVLGNQASDRNKGRILGAAVGAITGGLVGQYMDKQQAELERELKAEQEREELQISRLSDGSLKVGVASEASFAVDRSDLKPSSLATFGKIADVLQSYDKTIIHVVGHTDSTGSDAYNQQLSERRASSVAQYMLGNGVANERVLQEGRGEREPRSSNASASGRTMNRRVDIVIKPVVEGQEQQAFEPPPPLTS